MMRAPQISRICASTSLPRVQLDGVSSKTLAAAKLRSAILRDLSGNLRYCESETEHLCFGTNMTMTLLPFLRRVEYALEAIKQGSCAVGLVSKTHAVVVALKRNAEDLGSYQKKVIRIDDHMGIALAGLAPDARVLSNFMRQQAMSSKMIYNRPVPVTRVVSAIADKAQKNTQQYGRRPYGVGLLIIGYDEAGPHLFEFVSSGQVLEYRGTAIGARSQSSRTYLERTFESFPDASSEELILHGLRALRDSLAQDKELTFLNTSIGIVGADTKFKLIEGEALTPWLEKLGETSMTAVRARESAARNAAQPAAESQAAAEAIGGDAMEE